jgi:ADP-heptose:LPS heptosyltransferase
VFRHRPAQACTTAKERLVRPLPAQPRRIILLNPTRFLGNLLIAGGLIQDFAAQCRAQGQQFRLVVDAAFAGLLQGAFPAEELILYPRRELTNSGPLGKTALYLRCLRQIRQFRADLAFNIEDDSVAHRLTQLSGAGYRLGCSPARHRHGYEQVLPISFSQRPAGEEHRWHAFQEVFLALGLPRREPQYLRLHPAPLNEAARARLQRCGVDFSRPLALLHPGATKSYKLWPDAHFAALAQALVVHDYQVLLLGAGGDAQHAEAILAQLPAALQGQVVSICNQLSLAELASFLPQASLMAGNDSGPFHMAAALGLRAVVIFGPTEARLWGPIAPQAQLLQDRSVCRPDCSRHHCSQGYRCLSQISPQQVLQALLRSRGQVS